MPINDQTPHYEPAVSNVAYSEELQRATDGRGWLSGPADPGFNDGRVGDFWFNTASLTYFGPKTANGWASALGTLGTVVGMSDITDSLALGDQAGAAWQTGDSNLVVGPLAALDWLTGERNTILGAHAGSVVLDGDGNILIGHEAGQGFGSTTLDNALVIQADTALQPLLSGNLATGALGVNLEPAQMSGLFQVATAAGTGRGFKVDSATVVGIGYNAFTDDSNYERGLFSWASNVLSIGTVAAGTGTARNLQITRNGTAMLGFGVSAGFWNVSTGGNFFPGTTNASDIGTSSFKVRDVHVARDIYTAGGTQAVLRSSAAITSGAGAQAGTLTNAPAAGNPTKWIPINDNGTTRYIPAW